MQGKPYQVHMQNMEQLHEHDCHQNVIETQATEYHKKYTCVHGNCKLGLATIYKACSTQAGPAHTAGHVEMA